MHTFSKYVVYVDESGDASWKAAPEYPLLCVNYCLFEKDYYVDSLVPQFNRIKFKYWGSDNIVLHERDLRKPDKIHDKALKSKYERLKGDVRASFMSDLSALMDSAEFKCFCVVIDKDRVPEKFKAYDPYHISLSRGFRLITDYLRSSEPNELGKELHIVFEMRGRDDDASLSSAYQQIILQGSLLGVSPTYDFKNFRLELMDKKSNSTGLQIADLTARPIGNHYLHRIGRNGHADRRAAEIVMKKLLHCTPAGCATGKYDVFHETL